MQRPKRRPLPAFWESIWASTDPVACHLADDGEIVFEAFVTGAGALRKLLVKRQPRVVVIDACTPAVSLSDLCGECGVPCKIATSNAW